MERQSVRSSDLVSIRYDEENNISEAMQYRETLAILEKLNSTQNTKTIEEIITEEFPKILI